jgi:hypothetical protein
MDRCGNEILVEKDIQNQDNENRKDFFLFFRDIHYRMHCRNQKKHFIAHVKVIHDAHAEADINEKQEKMEMIIFFLVQRIAYNTQKNESCVGKQGDNADSSGVNGYILQPFEEYSGIKTRAYKIGCISNKTRQVEDCYQINQIHQKTDGFNVHAGNPEPLAEE